MRETYRNASSYPFCPGCGHAGILDHLNRALVKLQLDPRQTVIVSDIGCVGLSDQYFETNAFHGLHGRSIAYATGIKLARPDLEVVVVIGDGGCGIGGAHLLSAARRNIGITVLVFNNLNFGMTGGQHSVTTPPGATTATTPTGNLEQPLDLCATVAVNGAAFAYRGTVFEPDLSDRIAEAIALEGFALLDIWEMCTAYYVPSNHFSRKALLETMTALRLPMGIVHRQERPEYAVACRAAAAALPPLRPPRRLAPRFTAPLDRRFSLVLAGSAGGRVRSAARLLGVAATLSGLQAAQRDDYPVTVKTGYSVSEVILGPTPIDHTGTERPDAVVLVTEDGRRQAGRRLAAMTCDGRVFASPLLAGASTPAPVTVLDAAAAGVHLGHDTGALILLTASVLKLGLVPLEALQEAARVEGHVRAREILKVVAAGAQVAAVTADPVVCPMGAPVGP